MDAGYAAGNNRFTRDGATGEVVNQGQIKAADYVLVAEVQGANRNSGGSAIGAGITVYWNAGAQQATATSAGNKLIGKTTKAAADADATVRVRMMQ